MGESIQRSNGRIGHDVASSSKCAQSAANIRHGMCPIHYQMLLAHCYNAFMNVQTVSMYWHVC
jgi:hypothetical protein